MTQEQKAKAYDEALTTAKRVIRNNCTEVEKLCLECIFPELRESDDERIRKTILTKMRACQKQSNFFSNDEIAYLEKQKEQKPKFYPGDVIKCTSTGSLWVRCKDGDNIRSDGHTACIGGGYELASKEEAVQFFQELNENGYQWDCIKGRPMKKEQKPEQYDIDVLEKHITKDSISELAHTVIVRNGWEIVEAEQKPAEWNKATVNGGPIPTENQSIDIPLAEWSDEDADMLNCCISSIEEAKENRYAYKETDGDTSYDREIDWLKSLSRKFSLQPKQEWSEEDKTILKVITSDVARTMHRCGVGTDEWNIRSKVILWLENLCPNQKSEWGEEDERKRNGLIKGLEDRMGFGWASDPFSREEYIDWLKSLRPQPHTVSIKNATKFGNLEYERGVKDGIQSEKSRQWKPSEEQMDALRASNSYWKGTTNEVPRTDLLESLYNDLEKLIAKR